MKNYIIGIAGRKNSGKDTVASMINYIFTVGITRAKYINWMSNRISYDIKNKDRIIHFSDSLKDILSIMYNIPRNYFDDRTYKDSMYYNIKANTFIKEHNIRIEPNCDIITIDILKSFSLNTILKCSGDKQVYIKLRTLMQYFGTNVCREQLADDIWIRQTMNKAVYISEGRRVCIIPDVRFNNEAEAIKIKSDYLYGGLIMVNRDSTDKPEHDSEILNFTVDYKIDNNGTFANLFYKVLEYVQNII